MNANSTQSAWLAGGYLLLDKPAGLSSAAALTRLKHAWKPVKIGHAGTLDPAATGLLVVLFNGATRLANVAGSGAKTYQGIIRLGVTTSSDDLDGEVLSESTPNVSDDQVAEIASKFVGEIQQLPPRVSAIKVGGRRAYDLERKGVDFELQARSVTIDSLQLTRVSDNQLQYIVKCSPGTYVRSLARDIGEALGCGGAIETLRRTSSGQLDIASAVPLDQALSSPADELVQDWSQLLPELRSVVVPYQLGVDLLQGRETAVNDVGQVIGESTAEEKVIFRVEEHRFPLGILQRNGGSWGYSLNIAPQFFLPDRESGAD